MTQPGRLGIRETLLSKLARLFNRWNNDRVTTSQQDPSNLGPGFYRGDAMAGFFGAFFGIWAAILSAALVGWLCDRSYREDDEDGPQCATCMRPGSVTKVTRGGAFWLCWDCLQDDQELNEIARIQNDD